MAQFWNEDFAQSMVSFLFIQAHKEDKHYSNENEKTHDSDESNESNESDEYDESDEYLDELPY